jgi:pimeloyl-ACP methyl ester carboxylesterase
VKLRGRTALLALLPDIEIYHKAVAYPLRYNEIQKPAELKVAQELLAEGMERAAQLAEGEAPWLREHGLVVRGFRSRLDGSVQPYGLVIPDTYDFDGAARYRLDFWFHGRGERTTELGFIQGRRKSPGQYTPRDTIVLHPYARFSNGNKFAGEIDCLEALEHARQYYRVDEDRILVRGFSMGGAACWNLAVHYTDRWAAANPGAGFSETREFLEFFQDEKVDPPWYQKTLWHWYDCTDYAMNLYHLPTVAYSGEIDRQKQAADVMAAAMEKEGLSLLHLIGPDTAHKIHPDSKIEIERRLDAIAARGRERMPRKIRFTTWTLRYPGMHWVRLEGLEEHWKRARFEAELAGASTIEVTRIENVSAFSLAMDAGEAPLDLLEAPVLAIEGQSIKLPRVGSDRSFRAHLRKTGGKWRVLESPVTEGLAKSPGLQGPIDDAFMDSFLFVEPTGKPFHEATGEWVTEEMGHAIAQWRQQFRGDARVVADRDLSEEDIRNHNLVLWGDPSSNAILGKIAGRLPIAWTKKSIRASANEFDAGKHVLLMIYPNPLNPERYVVLNSSFTYREYDYLNNARQAPKLPDWAVVDGTTPMTSQVPGEVVAADFFDERWKLRKKE